MTRKYDFIDAGTTYAQGICAPASKAGAPDKLSLTITYAFMSLIAEPMSLSATDQIESFISENPDLLAKKTSSGDGIQMTVCTWLRLVEFSCFPSPPESTRTEVCLTLIVVTPGTIGLGTVLSI